MAEKKKPTKKVHAPSLLGVLVRCTSKHLLPGLFVIYKLRPAPPEKQKTQSFDLQLAAFHLQLAPELGSLPASLPDDKYTLAFVDSRGYLELVGEGEDPWRRFYGLDTASPHAPKINSAGTYACYFLRHPSVDKARELVRVLNGEAEADEDTTLALPRDVELKLETLPSGDQQLVLEVEESADWYSPKGSDVYDTWTLYRDMPHSDCAPVSDAVKKLHLHLGTLRYPVGSQETPYIPRLAKKPKPQKGEPPPPDRYLIDHAVQSAVLSFQKDNNAKNALHVDDRAKCHDRIVAPTTPFSAIDDSKRTSAETSWAFLDAGPMDADVASTMSPVFADAVVDRATGDAIGYWIEKGLRKAGSILVDVANSDKNPNGSTIYLRWEAAVQTKAWRELIKAMGCDYGLQSGHSYRDVSSGVNTKERGVASMSLHKTGMAIDLAVHGSEGEVVGKQQEDYTRPSASWPILFERRVENRTGASTVKDMVMHRITWRLYGHSKVNHDALATDAGGERTKLVAELEGLRASLRAYYSTRIGKDLAKLENAEVRAAVDAVDRTVLDLRLRLETDPAGFTSSFYRGSVYQWHYDPYSPEGGRAGGQVFPHQAVSIDYVNKAASSQVTVPGSRSFVNLTAIGRHADMLRISAQSSGWQDEAVDAEGFLVYKEKQKIPVQGNFGFIVGRLRGLAASRHAKSHIFAIAGETVQIFTLDEVDLDFMDAWSLAIARAKAPVGRDGATARVQLAAPPADAAVRSFAAALKGTFADKKFQCTNGIDLTWGDFALQLPAGYVLSGADWGARIEKMLDAIAEARTKRQAAEAAEAKQKEDEARARAEKAKKKYTPPAPGKGSKKSEPKCVGDWTLELHPLFYKEGDELLAQADQSIILPGTGTGRSLEWWHYQWLGANGKTWISLMEDIGYAREVLGDEAPAELYYRPGLGYHPPTPATENKKAQPGWETTSHGGSTDPVENFPGPLDRASLYEPAPPPKPKKPAPTVKTAPKPAATSKPAAKPAAKAAAGAR